MTQLQLLNQQLNEQKHDLMRAQKKIYEPLSQMWAMNQRRIRHLQTSIELTEKRIFNLKRLTS